MDGMKKTDNAELEKQIVERLENGESKDDIILDLCENMNINWPEAEALVNRIQSVNENKITLAQSPLLVLIALTTFIGGVILISITVYDIISVYNSYTGGNGPQGLGFLAYLFAYGGFFWELALLGLVMIIGSLKGMEEVWAAIFEKLGMFQASE